MTFTVWAPGHPDNAGGADRVRLGGATQGRVAQWDDAPRGALSLGYVIEFSGPTARRTAGLIPMPDALIEPFKRRFGIEHVHQGYGQSEVMGLLSRQPGARYKPNSLGSPASGIEIRLLDDRGHYRRMSRAHNPFGDGKASRRILDILAQEMGRAAAPRKRLHAL